MSWWGGGLFLRYGPDRTLSRVNLCLLGHAPPTTPAAWHGITQPESQGNLTVFFDVEGFVSCDPNVGTFTYSTVFRRRRDRVVAQTRVPCRRFEWAASESVGSALRAAPLQVKVLGVLCENLTPYPPATTWAIPGRPCPTHVHGGNGSAKVDLTDEHMS